MCFREPDRLELPLEPGRPGVPAADAGGPGARSLGHPLLNRLPTPLEIVRNVPVGAGLAPAANGRPYRLARVPSVSCILTVSWPLRWFRASTRVSRRGIS